MKSYTEYNFETKYTKIDPNVDLARDFFIPCMENAVSYDRITGFFGSTVYIVIWDALKSFVSNGAKMRILCSPKISDEDRTAINQGFAAIDSPILVKSMRDEIEDMFKDPNLQFPSRILSCLIATGVIEIKLVTTDYEDIPLNYRIMFHDKVGIFTDSNGNVVSFSGSMNETYNGLSSDGNSETISVNESWDPGRDGARTVDFKSQFETIWGGHVSKIKVHSLPSEIKEVFRKYSSLSKLPELLDEIKVHSSKKSSESYVVGTYSLKSHQIRAVKNWFSNNRMGVLKQATGSGKTVSGMYCIQDSLNRGEVPLLLVPSRDLQIQWRDELVKTFGESIDLLLCGGISTSAVWASKLTPWTVSGDGKKAVLAVLKTASSPQFINALYQGDHIFMLADEVHRLGSSKYRSVLSIKIGARLGLSATPERFGDEEGTAAIFSFFGPIVDTFSLKDALDAKRLTPYYYHPYVAHLTDSELTEWNKLTKKILNAMNKSTSDDVLNDENVKNLLITRSRIAKNARNKIPLAVKIIKERYQSNQRWLIYCDNIVQLNELWTILDSLHYPVTKYYSSMEGDRVSTLEDFNRHGGIILSIKCLDEGVDIPSVSHALIIASSQNPREFIQRRGRVLRLSDDKLSSTICDIIITPNRADPDTIKTVSLIESELARATEFGKWAINKDSCIVDLQLIALQFDINIDIVRSSGIEEEVDL